MASIMVVVAGCLALCLLQSLAYCDPDLKPLSVSTRQDGEGNHIYTVTYLAPRQVSVTWRRQDFQYVNTEETPIVHTFSSGEGMSSLHLPYTDRDLYVSLSLDEDSLDLCIFYQRLQSDETVPYIPVLASVGQHIAYTPGEPLDITLDMAQEPPHYVGPEIDWMFYGYNASAENPALETFELNRLGQENIVQSVSRNVSNGHYYYRLRLNSQDYEGLWDLGVFYASTAQSRLAVGWRKVFYVHQTTHDGPFPEGFIGIRANRGHTQTTCTVGRQCPLACDAYGINLSSVRLYKSGTLLPGTFTEQGPYVSKIIVRLDNTTRADAGEYTCRATNTAGGTKDSSFRIYAYTREELRQLYDFK